MSKLSRLQEEELFCAAAALPAAEREGYLRRACNGDDDLHARVRALLAASEDAAHFVKESPRTTPFENAGDRLGDYRLIQELGEGGGGTVYLAEQLAPVKREVALKIIKVGMDTRAVIARFEAERQALALMDHPNIASVFDAGATPTGRPYFVMELVRGIRITEYCDHSRLSIPERLALFVQVCQAIQHAHLKGVIHRDIKPSNVLVTLHDAAPLAKVIDFGVAKATQGRLSEHTLYTAIEQFVGTPAYVSPEQTEPGGLKVDARSDVYSLGVLLYELLTGCTPFDASDSSPSGLERMRRRIREDEPPCPSRRVRLMGAVQADEAAAARGLRPEKLRRRLLGDIDAIVMRALRREPERRYGSVEQLADDVRRHLAQEPVLARQGNRLYHTQRFLRRHAFAATLALAFVTFLIALSIVMSVQATRVAAERDRAEQESERAETVSEFMLNVFSNAEPFGQMGRPVTAQELLDRAGRTIRTDLSQHPEVRARLLEAIGQAHRRRGEPHQAISYLRDAVHIRKQLPNGDPAATAQAMNELAIALRQISDLEGAQRLLRDAMAMLQHSGNERSMTYAKVLANRGRLELASGDLGRARQDLERSLALTRALLGPNAREAADLLMDLTRILLWVDDLPAAEQAASKAVQIFEAAVPELHPDRVLAQARLAEVLYLQDRLGEAAALFERSLMSQRLLFGENSRQAADILDSLSKIRLGQDLLEQSERLAREAVRVQSIAGGEDHIMTAFYRASLAAVLIERQKYRDAERELQRSLQTYAKAAPPDHPYAAYSEHLLGEVFLATNRLSDAESILRASMNRWRRTDSPAWRAARSASALGEALHRLGRSSEAERYLRQSYRILATDSGVDHASRARARERIRRFYEERGRHGKLEETFPASRNAAAPRTTAGSR